MTSNAPATLDDRLAPLFLRVNQAAVLTIALLFVWVVMALGSVLFLLLQDVPGFAAKAGMVTLLVMGLLVPVQLLVLVSRLSGEIRKRAREHVGADRDFHLGGGAGSRRSPRWLALGADSLSVVCLNAALEIRKEDCEAIWTDGADVWIQRRGPDGPSCTTWSIPGFGRGDLAALGDLARSMEWPVVQVSPEEIACARARGLAAISNALPRKFAAPMLAMILTLAPAVAFVEWGRRALADSPTVMIAAGLGIAFACTCAFAAVAYWYALPALARAQRELWQLPVGFGGGGEA